MVNRHLGGEQDAVDKVTQTTNRASRRPVMIAALCGDRYFRQDKAEPRANLQQVGARLNGPGSWTGSVWQLETRLGNGQATQAMMVCASRNVRRARLWPPDKSVKDGM